jgi:putative DNA primase/helicase
MATAATAGKGALKRCHHPLKMETPTVMSAKRAKKSASKARSFGTLNQAIRFMVGKLKKVASRRDKYHSTDGTTHSVVVRFDGKDDDKEFIPFHPTASGWAIGDPPGEWPLFHLAKLLAPDFNPSSEPVFIPEGEKCVCALELLGLHATTSSHGSESAHKTDWAPMAGRLAVILPDKDKRGDGYAQSVAALLLQLSPPATVKIVELPGLTEEGDDCVEWITARNGKPPEEIRAELLALIGDAPALGEVPQQPPKIEKDILTGDLAELQRRYGEPYYLDKKGNPCAINQSFWAGMFATENVVLWEPAERDFYTYNAETGIYEEESVDVIKRRLSERLLEASRQTNCFFLETQRTNRGLNDVAAHLRGIVERRGAFVHGERRIHLANGIFRFEGGGELIPFSPALISRNRSPIAFDPKAKCPRFLNELIYPAMPEDDVVVVQKYFGQSLLGINLIQRMTILDGLSGRGKTQLANAIQNVVGRANCTQLRTELLGERFETYRLVKKTLLVGVDVAPDFLSTPGASYLKGLVGGDWFDAEKKGSNDSFQFQGNFGVIVTSNTRLRIRLCGDAGAWRRRLLIVRYEGPPPPKKIPDFGEKLAREEGAGILNFAIAGLGMLLKDIDDAGEIALSPRQLKIVDNLLAESDSLRLFLKESLEATEEWDLSVAEIVEAYAAFCPERGWTPLPITEVHRSLEGLMLDLFHVTKSHCIKRDGRSVRGFFGVRFK